MSTCFAFYCNDANLSAMGRAPLCKPLVFDSVSVDRWGIAHYSAAEALVRRYPSASDSPLDISDATSDLRSNFVVGHVAAPPCQPVATDRIQPLRFGRWSFSYAGNLNLDEHVLVAAMEGAPGYLRRRIRSGNTAELLFLLLLAHLPESTSTWDFKGDKPLPQATAFAEAIAAFEQHLQLAPNIPPEHAIIACDGQVLLAYRQGIPLAIARSGIGHLADDEDVDANTHERYPHLQTIGIIGGDRCPDGAGWEMIESGLVVTVRNDQTISVLDPENR